MNSGNEEVRTPQGRQGMKQASGISASLGAILSSLAIMGCCLPLGFAGALGAAGASAFLQRFRFWFLALSIVLLGIGFWQQRRERLCSVNPDPSLRVMVVWEPMLPTDLRSPVRSTLGRIQDKRARQFWDPQHLVAIELLRIAHENPGRPDPDCCVVHGLFWDDAILYPPHAKWRETPAAVFWNGPVVRVTSALEKALLNRP
jgi:hypothetical protein